MPYNQKRNSFHTNLLANICSKTKEVPYSSSLEISYSSFAKPELYEHKFTCSPFFQLRVMYSRARSCIKIYRTLSKWVKNEIQPQPSKQRRSLWLQRELNSKDILVMNSLTNLSESSQKSQK